MTDCPKNGFYSRDNRFIAMHPFRRRRIDDKNVVFCHCPGDIIFPVIDGVNGFVGGDFRGNDFQGAAFVEIMHNGENGWLCTPGVNVSVPPVRVFMAGDLMSAKIGGEWHPLYLWCEARKECLCESPVPDGRKFGDIKGIKKISLELMESIYKDLLFISDSGANPSSASKISLANISQH